MSNYTVQIFFAGLLAFAAHEEAGMVTSVTLVIPYEADHTAFVLWPAGTVQSSPSGNLSDIYQKLFGMNVPPAGWGGYLLDKDEITLSGKGNFTPIDLHACSPRPTIPTAISQFCWVPVVEKFSGSPQYRYIKKDFLNQPPIVSGLSARFKLERGSLKTYHLVEKNGQVTVVRALKAGSSQEDSPFDSAAADIAVLEIDVRVGQLLTLSLQGTTVRQIGITPGREGDVFRILIANLPKKSPAPETDEEQADHYSHLYDLSSCTSQCPDQRVPTWKKDYRQWPNEVLQNPDFCSMPEPLVSLYEEYSGTPCGTPSLVFQRPVCPMATFQVAP